MEAASVILHRQGRAGRITLNRPKALHALDREMCEAMLAALASWADDPELACVIVDHAEGTRGFCAGGDIRMLAASGRTDGREAAAFFAAEYRLNTAIRRFPKPYVALMDGVTMGGGVGISVHGSHRVATANTVFAMPETGIGLFPDVGGGWFLPRLEGELGTWIALTGARLKGADVAAAGVATHVVPADSLGLLVSEIGATGDPDAALAHLALPVGEGGFAAHRGVMDACFRFDSVAQIMAAVDAAGDDWARAQLDILRTKAPLSMSVTLRQLREGARLARFEDNMAMEFRIACRIVKTPDFAEGVRAVIEDKDNAPRWNPARVEDVDPADIEALFAPPGPGEALWQGGAGA